MGGSVFWGTMAGMVGATEDHPDVFSQQTDKPEFSAVTNRAVPKRSNDTHPACARIDTGGTPAQKARGAAPRASLFMKEPKENFQLTRSVLCA